MISFAGVCGPAPTSLGLSIGGALGNESVTTGRFRFRVTPCGGSFGDGPVIVSDNGLDRGLATGGVTTSGNRDSGIAFPAVCFSGINACFCGIDRVPASGSNIRASSGVCHIMIAIASSGGNGLSTDCRICGITNARVRFIGACAPSPVAGTVDNKGRLINEGLEGRRFAFILARSSRGNITGAGTEA